MTSSPRSVSGSPASQVDPFQLDLRLKNADPEPENVAQEKTQAAYKKCKERCEEIINLISNVSRPEATGQIGLGDFTVGAVAAVVASPAGPICSISAGIVAASVCHNAPAISSAVKSGMSSTSQWMQGITPPQQKSMEAHEATCLSFDPSSSGFGGSLAGRFSETVGDFRINLGEGAELSYRFNLKSEDGISTEDQNALFTILYRKVDENKLCPKRCIEILDGFNGLYQSIKGNEVTAIDDLSPFGTLRKLCNTKIVLNCAKEMNTQLRLTQLRLLTGYLKSN